ncbi:MAG: hypothetical protein EZS28_010326 [Streblomastix strix]|uniref:Uncharacterized protein n=1 Tax=Streblomastix strix TaxID=222440 RepID=A0A5J4WGW7_9EUKA|nr:MAG: hypothetical protein EZS28_010326 [Streblomastix strix]
MSAVIFKLETSSGQTAAKWGLVNLCLVPCADILALCGVPTLQRDYVIEDQQYRISQAGVILTIVNASDHYILFCVNLIDHTIQYADSSDHLITRMVAMQYLLTYLMIVWPRDNNGEQLPWHEFTDDQHNNVDASQYVKAEDFVAYLIRHVAHR